MSWNFECWAISVFVGAEVVKAEQLLEISRRGNIRNKGMRDCRPPQRHFKIIYGEQTSSSSYSIVCSAG